MTGHANRAVAIVLLREHSTGPHAFSRRTWRGRRRRSASTTTRRDRLSLSALLAELLARWPTHPPRAVVAVESGDEGTVRRASKKATLFP